MEFTVPSILPKRRDLAFRFQGGRCYYCGCTMLQLKGADLSDAPRYAKPDRLRLCTAEHLRAQVDGGTHARRNLVAACWYCNSSRHARYGGIDAVEYRAVVRQQVKAGIWPTIRQQRKGGASQETPPK